MRLLKNTKRRRVVKNKSMRRKSNTRKHLKGARKIKKRKQTRKAYRPSSHSLRSFFAAFN